MFRLSVAYFYFYVFANFATRRQTKNVSLLVSKKQSYIVLLGARLLTLPSSSGTVFTHIIKEMLLKCSNSPFITAICEVKVAFFET